MKIFLGIVLALTCVSGHQNFDNFINEINTKQNLWRAGKKFRDTPVSALESLYGARQLPESIRKTIPVVKHQLTSANIPKFFDARTKWPECKSIQEIRDQSSCGSCWAVSASAVISDRICIYSNGTSTPDISAKDLMACEAESEGCNGGYHYYALVHWKDHGLVTGGPYGSSNTCLPYPFPPCEHHTQGSKPPCPNAIYDTPDCVHECYYNSLVYKHDRHFGRSVYAVEGEEHIQAEIMRNGPVNADFKVYDDFHHYESGIYRRTSNNRVSGHAIRIIGWGEENGTKYWLITNSWNEDWGEKGLFRMIRGVNDCDLESNVLGGIPQ